MSLFLNFIAKVYLHSVRKFVSLIFILQEVAKDLKMQQLPARSLNASLAVAAVLNIGIFLPYLTHGRGGILMGPYLLLWAATLTTSLRYGFLAKPPKAN
jgi:hypothetical protein